MDISALYQLHLEGVSVRELSRQTGINTHTIARRFREAGLSPRSPHDARVLACKARAGIKRSDKTAYDYVRKLRERKGEIVRRWRNDRGCKLCGESHPAALDLHHPDPLNKNPRLKRKNSVNSRRTGGYFWRDLSFKDLKAELAKCDVLCSNCHRILTWESRGVSG